MADANQSASPYVAGTILTISPHTPQSVAVAESHDYTAETTQLAQTYQFREVAVPYPTSAQPHESGAQFRKLEIIGQIAVGRDQAQVVLCKVALTPNQQPNCLAAKIFDTRCYGQEGRWGGNQVLAKLVKHAKLDYSSEAAAYQRIKAHESTRPSHCTLDYFGAWSFQLIPDSPLSSKTAPSKICNTLQAPRQTRTVNLILLEYIKGSDLHNIMYSNKTSVLDNEYRMNVWAQFAECQNWLEHIGVRHEDIVEHNVMVTPAPLPTLEGSGSSIAQRTPRVVLIDFGMAELDDLSHNIADLPQNPIVRYWTALSGLADWCPKRFVGYLPERRKWLIEKYGRDPRYQRVDPPLNPDELDGTDRMYMEIYGFK